VSHHEEGELTIAALAHSETAESGGVRRPLATAANFATVGLFIIAFVAVLHFGSSILAPTVGGFLVGLTLAPVVDWLKRRGLPPALSSALIVLTSVGAIAGLIVAMAVPLETWSARIPEITSELEQKWEDIRGPLERLKQVEEKVNEATAGGDEAAMEVAVKSPGVVTAMVSSAPDISAHVLIFLATLYFFLAGRTGFRRQVLASFVRFRRRRAAARMFREIERSLSRYVLTIAGINAAFGVIVGLVMWGLGLPSPHLWGAMAAVLNFALYIGPATMAVILLGVGAITFDSAAAVLAPPLAFITLNLMEGQFITPTVLGHRFAMTPMVVFLSLVLWLWVWGILGAFMAVPLLIVFRIVLYHLAPRFRLS